MRLKNIFLRSTLVLILLAGLFGTGVGFAQDKDNRTFHGKVVDENQEPLIGVNIVLVRSSKIGATTNLEGEFKIENVKIGDNLKISYVGYESVIYKIMGKESFPFLIKLKPSSTQFDEVVAVGMAKQRKVSVVGAITTIDPEMLDIPSSSITNNLAGIAPGIIAVQHSGEPGEDASEFWVRGISTFGANSRALVLIDGIEGNLNNINPADIESFSILKDASATAVYGVRGANGVIIITTKSGRDGRLSVNVRSSVTASYAPRMPQYLRSYDYALLANEARIVSGLSQKYSDVDMQVMKYKLDEDLYPDVNWRDVILKKFTLNNNHYISMSGGGKAARYFMSIGANYQEGLFKTEKGINKYNTNIDFQRYSFRGNIITHLTSSTDVSLLMDATISNKNAPGFGDNNNSLWAAQANLTPLTVPVRYSNGLLPAYGRNGNQISPYVLLNYSGYKAFNNNAFRTSLKLNQNLDDWVKGLCAELIVSYNHDSFLNSIRQKMPNLYKSYGRYGDGTLMLEKTVDQQFLSFSKSSGNSRMIYFQGQLNYNRIFNNHHRVGGLVHAYRQESVSSTTSGSIASIPKRYQAVSGRATYSYDDTYITEFNIGITGSENFEPGHQYGAFPSIAVGWIPTQYKYVQERLPYVTYFKIRGSYGHVGNDRITGRRFPYLTLIQQSPSRWSDGTIPGYTESQIGANNLRWEVAQKFNLGVDWILFKDKFGGTIDIFKDLRNNIFQERQRLPEEVGAVTLPFTNIGRMHSYGVDGNAYVSHQFSDELKMTVRGNLTFAHNNVDHWDQVSPRYSYQSFIDKPLYIQRGLIAMGLFRDSIDVVSSPKQTFGPVRPGDIKYKDVNGDGKVDNDDIVPISYSSTPEVVYGLGAEVNYKSLRVGLLFTGASRRTYFVGGQGYYPFVGEEIGNVLSIVAQRGNRWTPAWYSGSADTENPNAIFPRLSYGNNPNNNRNSTFWLRDGSFLRWKNIDIAYHYRSPWMRKIALQSLNLRFIGENLLSIDKIKLWDPEQASSNGAVYPIPRSFTFQVTAMF